MTYTTLQSFMIVSRGLLLKKTDPRQLNANFSIPSKNSPFATNPYGNRITGYRRRYHCVLHEVMKNKLYFPFLD